MNEHPAIRTARVYARYGRLRQAIETLETARLIEPGDDSIERELAGLRRLRDRESSLGGIRHQVTGWLCLLVALTATFGPLVVLSRVAKVRTSREFPGGPIAAVVSAVVVCGALVWIASRLFLWLWFNYLVWLDPEDRPIAEHRLAQVLNVTAFEPQYSRSRRARLGEDASPPTS